MAGTPLKSPMVGTAYLSPSPEAPAVLTDLTLPAYDPSAVGEIVDVLAPSCDAVLVGEHQNRPELPPR